MGKSRSSPARAAESAARSRWNLPSDGADVALVGRDAAALEETARRMRRARGPGPCRSCSRATLPIRSAVDRVVAGNGYALWASGLRGRQCGAVGRRALVAAQSRDDRSLLDVNLKSAFYLCAAVAKPMMKQRSGSIVLVSSIVGMTGNAGQAAYAASKAGLLGSAQVGSKGVGFEEYKSQRRRAGPHRDRNDRKNARRRQRILSRNKPHSDVRVRRRTSAAPSRFFAPMPPATSPDRRSSSTAAIVM